ncbi:MAG: serine/threonine protein kinase, partial [Actinomycetes bacterium]
TQGAGRSNKLAWLMIPAALLALFVIVKVASGSNRGTTTAATSTVTSTPAWTPTETVTETATQTAPPTKRSTAPVPVAPSGDLNLGTPMSRPACDGTGIVIVGNSTNPARYREQVAQLLADNPGSSYLRTDMSCRSLKQKSDDGYPIYAVYYIAGPDRSQVCTLKARIRSAGNDVAYGKWLYSEAWSEGIEC